MKEQVAEQQRAMEEAEERENYATINLNDDEENLRLITALDQPSLGGPGHVEGLLDQQDHKGVGVDLTLSTEERKEADNGVYDQQGHEDQQDHEGDGVDEGVKVVKQAGKEVEEQSENPPSLDSSLETVFGPGATQLAKELENNLDKKEELITSDTGDNSDSEVEHLNGSNPPEDQRKKRGRMNIKIGEPSSMEGAMDTHGASSEGEHSEEASKEVKKPRLGENKGAHEEDNNLKRLEKENVIAEDKTKKS